MVVDVCDQDGACSSFESEDITVNAAVLEQGDIDNLLALCETETATGK